jgi:hypothetical protein
MNCKLSADKKTLTIELPFDVNGTASASGKTNVNASTRGNVQVSLNGSTYRVGVNVYSDKK